ncbi:MAG: hypothetical protein MMC33_003303 [Icmadophila ericetorum]|nr:hypothetical protein [Icmadophila ericetorum]
MGSSLIHTVILGLYNTQSGEFSEKDEKHLIMSYPDHLHPRRTLDQFYYYMLDDTEERDKSQVVYKWGQKARTSRWSSHKTTFSADPYIMMVDQLWLWVVDDFTVITSFPETWGKTSKDDVSQRICAHIRDVKNRAPITTAPDLAAVLIKHYVNVLGRVKGPEYIRFIEFFESSVGEAADQETTLFAEFQAVSAELNKRDINAETARNLLENLFNIERETELLKQVKDIEDELNVILEVLEKQCEVMEEIGATIGYRSLKDKVGRLGDGRQNFARYKNTYGRLWKDAAAHSHNPHSSKNPSRPQTETGKCLGGSLRSAAGRTDDKAGDKDCQARKGELV